MAVRLSASHVGRALPPGRFLILIFVRGSVNPRAIVRLEGLGKMRNPMTSSGFNLAIAVERIVMYHWQILLVYDR
jgi:hypothetical protein